jgi:murein L,D-transpeptidase YcbB/YkuD
MLDLALSVAAARFVHDVHHGRIEPATVGFDLNPSRPPLDVAAVLGRLATADDPRPIVTAVEPGFLHYRLLQAALARYRTLAAGTAFTPLPALPARSVKPGEAYAGAAALRERLGVLGDLTPSTAAGMQPVTLDPSLVAGLMNFQRRHGLTVDGILGRQTLAALEVPLAARVGQIELTLERWRWLSDFQTPPIIVNIPQFRLFALRARDDREAGMLEMEVVVGESYPERQTPVFLEQLRYLVFRPYWDVPASITRREFLPLLRSDPDFLRRRHMEIVDGAGDAAPVLAPTEANVAALARGELRLRQRPGPDNALGEIKFMFPNRYNVYLHSTPARALFRHARRAFSHGCIRVSKPAALAQYVLEGEPGDWDMARIEAAMDGPPNRRVTLTRPIQVMILYATAMATESGRIYFFEDVYGHDARLRGLLEQRSRRLRDHQLLAQP